MINGKATVSIFVSALALFFTGPSRSRQIESPRSDGRQITCQECARLIGKVRIQDYPSSNRAKSQFVFVPALRPWTTVRIDVIGAGPACSADPLVALLAARVLREDLDKSNIVDFGVSTTTDVSFTGPNVTVIADGPAEGAAHWVKLLTSAIRNPQIPEEAFQTVKGEVLAEILKLPERPLIEGALLASALFDERDPGVLVREAQDVRKEYSYEGVLDWRTKHYLATNFRLGVVGPPDKRLLKLLSDLTRAGQVDPCSTLGQSAEQKRAPYVQLTSDTKFSKFYIAAPAPTTTTSDRIATLIANRLLGGGPESRFRQAVRDEQGLSYDIGSRIEWNSIGPPWVISGSSPNQDLGGLIESVTREVCRLARDGPSKDELLWAKTAVLDERAMNSEQPAAALERIMLGVPQDRSLDALVKSVTVADIKRQLSTAFLSGRAHVVVIGPILNSVLTGDWVRQPCGEGYDQNKPGTPLQQPLR
jgi:predicted Zn-dependent peptidase